MLFDYLRSGCHASSNFLHPLHLCGDVNAAPVPSSRHVVHQVNPVVQTVGPNVESAFHLGSIFHRASRVPNPPQPNMAVLGSASVLQLGGIRHAEARAPPGWMGGFEHTHSSIRGSNRKGVALLSYHRFLEPLFIRPQTPPPLGSRDRELKPSVHGNVTFW